MGATYYAKNYILGTMIHNTHLRTTNMNDYSFVDAALYSLFGLGIQFLKLGEEASEEKPLNQSTFLARNRVDGMYIPYNQNVFRYPHPSTELEALLYQIQELPVNA